MPQDILNQTIQAICNDDNEVFKETLPKLPYDVQEEMFYLVHQYEATNSILKTLKEHLDRNIPEEKQLTIDQMAEILKQLDAEEPDRDQQEQPLFSQHNSSP